MRRPRQLTGDPLGKLTQSKWADRTLGDLPTTTTNTSSDATADELRVFDAMYRAKMAKLGATGGKIDRKRPLETMSPKKQRDASKKSVAVRQSKRRSD